ncbi:MAG: prepilin-type N-terminal cleavage/methylation domain-containing protein [Pseudomonadota bacterium]
MHPTNASLRHELGVTLIELLIVLAIISLFAGIVGLSMRESQIGVRIEMQRFAQELVSDLVACREASVTSGETCSVDPAIEGYTSTINQGLKRWPSRIKTEWDLPVTFREGGPNGGHRLLLSGGRRQLTITVEPYTGRVSQHAE